MSPDSYGLKIDSQLLRMSQSLKKLAQLLTGDCLVFTCVFVLLFWHSGQSLLQVNLANFTTPDGRLFSYLQFMKVISSTKTYRIVLLCINTYIYLLL